MDVVVNKKALIVGDLHIGLKNSDEKWLKIVEDVALWVANVAKEYDISDIIMMGDFFHDRTEINLQAMNTAHRILNAWKNFNVHMIVGNHDAYLKENSTIHSLVLFKEYSWVHIYDDVYQEFYNLFNLRRKEIIFCPWGTEPEQIPPCDYIFGHFEIDTFKMGHKLCDGKLSAASLLEKAPNIYTGHFHAKQTRKYSNGQITYVGTPYQMDWGDVSVDKFIHILDFETGELTPIENTFSPKHLHVKGLNLENITGNIIKFELNKELTPEQTIEVNSKNPFKWEAIYEETSEAGLLETPSQTLQDVDKVKLFDEYINLLAIPDDKVKNKVNEKMAKLKFKIK